MNKNERIDRLRHSIIYGETQEALDGFQMLFESNIDARRILTDVIAPAAEKIGDLYENGELFLPDMLIAGDIMKHIMKILKPKLKEELDKKFKGVILIGTVEGDIHDIGKSFVISLLEGQGIEVVDLGNDVSPQKFIEKAREINPKVIGLSGLLTMSISKMVETVNLLKQEKISSKVIVGGGILSKESCDMIGADDFAKDGWEGIQKILKLMESV
jgi:methanogenic corrinoid protein MtbC1